LKLYFDTAYLAKCYLNEPDGKAVRRLARRATGLYSSLLAVAELACVFQRQIREGRMDVHQAAEWRGTFLEDLRNAVWVLFPVSGRLLYRIEALISALPPAVYVRAGDAIRLVTARESGFEEIWSNDRRLLAAAEHFGLRGRSV
jgi:predicted nucleic acid-binding protein